MSTHRSTWKRREREAARLFGAERQPLSGSGGRADRTRSDSTHDRLFVECRILAKTPAEFRKRFRERPPVFPAFHKGEGPKGDGLWILPINGDSIRRESVPRVRLPPRAADQPDPVPKGQRAGRPDGAGAAELHRNLPDGSEGDGTGPMVPSNMPNGLCPFPF
jgi:hypothetical protein